MSPAKYTQVEQKLGEANLETGNETLQIILDQIKQLSQRLDSLGEGFTGSDRKVLITCEVQTSNLLAANAVLGNRIGKLEDEHVNPNEIEDLQDQLYHLRDFGEERQREADKILPALRHMEASIQGLANAVTAVELRMKKSEEDHKREHEKQALAQEKIQREIFHKLAILDRWKLKTITAAATVAGMLTALFKFGPALFRWVGILPQPK